MKTFIVGALLSLGIVAVSAAPCGLDLVFVIDSSQSVTENKFTETKEMIDKIVSETVAKTQVGVGASGTQVSLVTFNDVATVNSHLNSATNLQELKQNIQALSYVPGLTNTADALQTVYNDVLQTSAGDRAANPNVVVLITDGLYTQGTDDPSITAKRLKTEKHATVAAIGVEGINGANVGAFHRQLAEMTGDLALIFDSNTYLSLVTLLTNIVNKCSN